MTRDRVVIYRVYHRKYNTEVLWNMDINTDISKVSLCLFQIPRCSSTMQSEIDAEIPPPMGMGVFFYCLLASAAVRANKGPILTTVLLSAWPIVPFAMHHSLFYCLPFDDHRSSQSPPPPSNLHVMWLNITNVSISLDDWLINRLIDSWMDGLIGWLID